MFVNSSCDIISPICFLTVSDISVSLIPSNAIGIHVTLGWFMFESLKGPVVLFDFIFTSVGKPWFICNVLQYGSEQRHGIISIRNGTLVQTDAAQMLKLFPICLH